MDTGSQALPDVMAGEPCEVVGTPDVMADLPDPPDSPNVTPNESPPHVPGPGPLTLRGCLSGLNSVEKK
jgi:hypothetical protein